MIEQIDTFKNNVLALEVIDGFTQNDEKICQKFFNEKIENGFNTVNVLVKLDELKLNKSSIKAFVQDTIFALKNYPKMQRLAIVGNSGLLKSFVNLDGSVYKHLGEGKEERYFDISEFNQAMDFVNQ